LGGTSQNDFGISKSENYRRTFDKKSKGQVQDVEYTIVKPEFTNGRGLLRLPFLAKIADVDSTQIIFENPKWVKKGQIVQIPSQSVKLSEILLAVNICKDGGEQFVKFATKKDVIKSIAPNPSSGNSPIITFTMENTSECSLSLVDVFGRVLQEVHCDKLPKGEHSMELDDLTIETGTYYVVMRTRFCLSSQKITIIK
jgi:hypothetical protein